MPPIFADNEHGFHNVELNLKQNYVWKQLFLDFRHKIIILFSDLIFPDFSLTDKKFPDFLVKFSNSLTFP